MVVEHGICVVQLRRIDLETGVHAAEAFPLPEHLRVFPQPRGGVFHLFAVLPERTHRRPAPDAVPDHAHRERKLLRQQIILVIPAQQHEPLSECFRQLLHQLKHAPGIRSAVEQIAQQDQPVHLRIRRQSGNHFLKLVGTAVNICKYYRPHFIRIPRMQKKDHCLCNGQKRRGRRFCQPLIIYMEPAIILPGKLRLRCRTHQRP